MNNGERILRAKGEFTSLTVLSTDLNYSGMCGQVNLRSQLVMWTVNSAAANELTL